MDIYEFEKVSLRQGFKHSMRFLTALFDKKKDVEFDGERRVRLTLSDQVFLTWGKIRRQYLIQVRPVYVQQSLARRKGKCIRCGNSCKLLFSCPLLCSRNGNSECELYTTRPSVCRLFPIDERDLRDRNRISPEPDCGYWFES